MRHLYLALFAAAACDPMTAPPISSQNEAVASAVHELAFADDPAASSPTDPSPASTDSPTPAPAPTAHTDVIPVYGSAYTDVVNRLGYGRLAVNGVPAFGDRPLLVVMLDFSDRAFAPHGKASIFETMFFGPSPDGDIDIGTYTEGVSDGLFRWSSAGVLRLRAHDLPATSADESSWQCIVAERCGITGYGSGELLRVHAVRAAVRAGFDFARYDTDGNGRVTQDELQLHVVEAWNDPNARGGANRWVSRCIGLADGAKVEICPGRVGSATEFGTIETHAHELLHSLGTADLYNASCDSRGLTLMSCIGNLVALDPWHRIQLGWAKPRAFELDGLGRCESLGAIGEALDQPIALVDQASDDIFIFELRRRGGFDRDLAQSGVAVWRVTTSGLGDLAQVPGEILEPGPNGVLDTVPRGDDWTSVGSDRVNRLFGGANRLIDSVIEGDDRRIAIKGNVSLSAASGFLGPGTPGGPTPWSAGHGPGHLVTSSGLPTGTWFAVSSDLRSLVWGHSALSSYANPPAFSDPDGLFSACMSAFP
jgi:M6 family metalloprotease-like protein